MRKAVFAAFAVLSFALAGSVLAPVANAVTSVFPPNQYEGGSNN